MSNALAIATVTTALARIVEKAAQSVVTGAEVVTGRPDSGATPAHRVHLFLYQVSANAAMRNNDLPSRSPDGNLAGRPTIALDLHYLLAFYGSDANLEPQRMLGAVVRDLNTKLEMFPIGLLGRMTGFREREYFQADKDAREAPAVQYP